MEFCKDFVWGAATSAFQIEGAFDEDGKGLSIWDVFCKKDGVILENQNGETACDHYHHMKEDVRCMKEMGLQAYRFSISWPRVLPEGTGRINEKGLQFYSALVDELLSQNIEPYITLYHWDFPQALQQKGGFLNRESADWFAEYTEVVARRLGDRVKYFCTFNEPQVFISGAYQGTMFAPGIPYTTEQLVQTAHNVLLAHGKAVRVLRREVKDVKIGYAPTGNYYYPASWDAADIEAARKAVFEVNKDNWLSGVAWWSDPVFLGKYPESLPELTDILQRVVQKGDMELISQPLDFYAQNIYWGKPVRAAGNTYEPVPFPEGYPRTAIGWKVTPQILYWVPRFLCDRYHMPLYITENGMSCHDVRSLDGAVHDPNRIDFLHRYLRALHESQAKGVKGEETLPPADIRGYFHWSLMDNFEWANGYNERFGLVYIDYATQERTLKDSAHWYKAVIESNGRVLF